jgi:hypothetical protein
MEQFETKITGGLMAALVKWQGVKPSVNLDKTVDQKTFKYKYATLSNIIKHIDKPLAECGLSYTQIVSATSITTVLCHAESEGMIVSSRPIIDNLKVQEEGSFITYQKRYQLAAVLGISAEEDNDGNDIGSITNALPACTDKMIEALITGKQKGLPSGNRQAVEMLYGSTRMTVAQLRKLFMAELFAFEELTVALIERMESDGYEVKKVS